MVGSEYSWFDDRSCASNVYINQNINSFWCCCVGQGVNYFKKFTIRININPDPKMENEFKDLGGGNYTYIPASSTRATVGGLSKNSLYYKTIKRNLGYIEGYGKVDLDWKFYKEKLDAEYALAVVDEGFVGNEISRFTGSVASDKLYDASNQPITDDYEIREFGSDNVFMAKDISGFYSGSITRSDGSIDTENGEAWIIHTGIYNNHGELGEHPGNTEISHTRLYIDGNLSMWEQLGFTDNEAGNPQSPRYWQNIIPETYNILYDRTDVEYCSDIGKPLPECEFPGDIVVFDGTQEWDGQNEYGNIYYYPVLPLLDEFGRMDESLGLQGNKIPFGDRDNWSDMDDSSVTKDSVDVGSLAIDTSNAETSNESVNDLSGNRNIAVRIGDYRVIYDEDNIPDKSDFIGQTRIDKFNKAF